MITGILPRLFIILISRHPSQRMRAPTILAISYLAIGYYPSFRPMTPAKGSDHGTPKLYKLAPAGRSHCKVGETCGAACTDRLGGRTDRRFQDYAGSRRPKLKEKTLARHEFAGNKPFQTPLSVLSFSLLSLARARDIRMISAPSSLHRRWYNPHTRYRMARNACFPAPLPHPQI
ncbi:hypothetical protein F5148DRAFT_493215 [Russula earlei]|uniref:Uncharacterized protein n=1 Tax=Russula earlei TaxID=71964 RepID=A0ACC0TXU1_9AGAM|nr:hypothetical protein F5148DRAFT_493215 [Russula earlei]